MASNAKRKTTMAKLQREQRLRERRFEKQARKEARKLAPPEEVEVEVVREIRIDDLQERSSATSAE